MASAISKVEEFGKDEQDCSEDNHSQRTEEREKIFKKGNTDGVRSHRLDLWDHLIRTSERSALRKDSYTSAFKSLRIRSELGTLGGCLEAFGMFPRLLKLDESLEDVRRYRKPYKEHERECKLLDSDLQKIYTEHYPDHVVGRLGSRDELIRAKELQTALGATRAVLKTLSKMFLDRERIDVVCRYEFFAGLYIALQANEEDVLHSVYQVFHKALPIWEAKQETIVGGVRNFLRAARHCVESYIRNDSPLCFTDYRRIAFLCLESCVARYRELLSKHEEVLTECRDEKLHKIYATLYRMKRHCSTQLRHLEALLELWKLPFGRLHPMYSSNLPVDNYFVHPFVCYTNVILACSIILRVTFEELIGDSCISSQPTPTTGSQFKTGGIFPVLHVLFVHDNIPLLHQLALCYSGNVECTTSLKKLFGWERVAKENVKIQFLDTLKNVQLDLESKFKIENYIEYYSMEIFVKKFLSCEKMTETLGPQSEIQKVNRDSDCMQTGYKEAAGSETSDCPKPKRATKVYETKESLDIKQRCYPESSSVVLAEEKPQKLSLECSSPLTKSPQKDFPGNGQKLVECEQEPANSDAEVLQGISNLSLVNGTEDEVSRLDAGDTNSGQNQTSDSAKFPQLTEVHETGELVKGPKDLCEHDQNFNSVFHCSARSNIPRGASVTVETGNKNSTGNNVDKTGKLSDSEKSLKTVEDVQKHSSEISDAKNSEIIRREEKECENSSPGKHNRRYVGKETLHSPNLTPSEIIGTGQKHFVENDQGMTSEGQQGAQGGTPSEVSGKEEEESELCGCSTSSILVKPPNPSPFEKLTTNFKLRTLEDCLEAFGMFPRLLELDESLEEVRRRRSTAEEHEMERERLDKDLRKLSLEYHPDRVMRRGGTEEEKTRAGELQRALNATRTVLKTLSKIFLEDMDIEHRYEFYTKLDIGLLVNEDEEEEHAYQVLFNISLISEIRQEPIIGAVRMFVRFAQKCVRNFSKGERGFTDYRRLAFSYLERCVGEYRKLYAEHEEVEMQCRKENLRNVYPTIRKMKRVCSTRLRHLEALLELSKRPFGEPFPVYNSTLPVDDYFVLPFVCYTVVILSCSLLGKLSSEEDKKRTWFDFPSFISSELGKSPNSIVDFDFGDDDQNFSVLYGDHEDIVLLYKLALCYGSNRKCSRSVREHFGWRHTVKGIVKGQFLETLETVQVDLENRFQLEDYFTKSSKIHSLMADLEMTETVQEIGKKTKMLETDIQEMEKNNEYMKRRLDEVLKN